MWSARRLSSVTRWLLQFGYDGEGFSGWARQPDRPTIEGTLREGLVRSSLVRDLDSAVLEVASRTDAGVSARANALAISTPLQASSLLRGMNGLSPAIFFTAAREVPSDFRVRGASWREYRYYLPGDRPRTRRLAAIASQLPAEIDVRSFGRGFPPTDPVLRPIDRVRVRFDGRGVRMDIRARSFVWGMVRKVVGGLTACEEHRLPLTDLIEAAAGIRRLTLPLAPADGLVLWEVHYPNRWTVRYTRRTREQEAHLVEVRRRAEVRARVGDVW